MPSLREARLQALLSIRQLARRAGLAPTTSYVLETRQRTPQLLTVYKLSRALDVDPEEIDEFRSAFDIDAETNTDDRKVTP